ncbi:endonuclease/exonuclease/phosphatase family protein [Hydrogenophaga sp.]|uniref:endonuclease/exonuclease/phosphatase family protein n=1 Tax=Hydrogenophaga sp. TaxID=1904254 RepID=UPI003569E9EF
MNLRTLTIASCNLYNLNLPGLRMYTDSNGWTEAEYQRKIRWTAQQLLALDADLIGLQELWHEDALAAVLVAAGLESEYDTVLPPNTRGQRIVCAALVRKGLLVGQPDWISDFPPNFLLSSAGDDPQSPQIGVNISGFSRPVLHLNIQPRSPGPQVQVFVCHFKSKGPTKVYREAWYRANTAIYSKHATSLGSALSTIRRTAEAAALRFWLTEQLKANDTPAIVLGDLNDGQHSNTTNILTEQPQYLMGESMGGGDVALYTAQTLQQFRDTRDVYYTHVHQNVRESLDHILVSQEFYDHSKKRIWLFDGLQLNNDHLNTEDHKADGSTDHGVIRASFKYKPYKK